MNWSQTNWNKKISARGGTNPNYKEEQNFQQGGTNIRQ
jgi:hypothetical protein